MTIAASHVATLIAPAENPCLTHDVIDVASKAVAAVSTTILAQNIACDFFFEATDTAAQVLRGAVSDLPIDIAVQPAKGRRKRILLADMDSTMIEQECLDELADAAGAGAEVAAITAQAMAGEIEFEPALRARVSTLAGKPANLIDNVLANRITLMPGGRELVATMRANGGHCVLVSGGFVQFTSQIAATLGFHENHANRFELKDGSFTGNVVPPVLGREAKVEVLDATTARLGLAESDVIAVGDGANDLGMLQRAGTGVALHAKPIVAEAARIRIDHGDLTALLYLQGYSAADFVTA